MILVCAATGRIGSRTVDRIEDELTSTGVIAGVRDASKATSLSERGIELRTVDYDDPLGVEAAFKGVERVVLIPSFADTDTRAQQCRNVITAAEKAGVRQIVFIGLMDNRADSPIPFARAYGEIEQALNDSALDFTVLRTSMYTDNLAEQYPMWIKNGVLVTCAGDGKISYVSRDDIVSSVVGVLRAPISDHARTTYRITGPVALNYQEVADIVSKKFDANIEVKEVEREEFAARLQEIWGISYEGFEHVLRVTPLFQTAFKQGVMAPVTNDVERLTGRSPETVEVWLERNT